MQDNYKRRRFRTSDVYHELTKAKMEDFGVFLHINGRIIIQQIRDNGYDLEKTRSQIRKSKNDVIEKEKQYVIHNSFPKRDRRSVTTELSDFIDEMDAHCEGVYRDPDSGMCRQFYDILMKMYTSEVSLSCSVALAKMFTYALMSDEKVYLQDITDLIIYHHERDYAGIYALIQTKKTINRMHQYAPELIDLIKNRKAIDGMISEIDASIFEFEDIIMKWLSD